ncbi:hypothetical protein ACN4EG_08705 [Alkalinema pantanalense CENA528]|uniref:hypothetical protein n=1 Tax=Alkalinema pantanalense TaxID=1620705 RepID=UPI003D6DBF9C
MISILAELSGIGPSGWGRYNGHSLDLIEEASMIVNQDFQLLHEATIAEDGTLHLGKNAIAKRYRILINADGQMLLDPIDDREQWLWQNPEAIAAVQTGIKQAAQGQTRSLGSFGQYANLEVDDI